MKVLHKIYLLVALALLSITIIAVVTINSLNALSHTWGEYQSDVAPRQEEISTMRSLLGYGGFIHNFKNYVLRGTPKYYDRIYKGVALINGSIQRYGKLADISEEEKKALVTISETVILYRNATDIVKSLYKTGRGPEAIDKIIKISDGPAIKALEVLNNSYKSQTKEHSGEMVAKVAGPEKLLGVSFVISVFVLFGVGILISRSITLPLGGEPQQMKIMAETIAGGDITIKTNERAMPLVCMHLC